jgi:hypothetical protein
MGKYINDLAADAAFSYLTGVCNRLSATDGSPITSVPELAYVTIDSGDFTGPANGDDSGRKITINEQADVAVTAAGEADHVGLIYYESIHSFAPIYITTCDALTLVYGGLVTFPAWKIEIADPI